MLAQFLFAVALTAWYAGAGPAVLSIVLSILCFTYFFAPPIHSFAFTVADVPAVLILVSFGVLITAFSAVRRRVEGQLLQARDELQADIDVRNRAEEKLRRSEGYLAEAQRLSKTASWAWSPVTRQSLYWSEEMFRIYGFDPQQGLPPAEIFWGRVHPEDRDEMSKLMRKAVHEKKEYAHEHRIVLPDGTVKYIHAIGRPLLDAGEVVEYVGTLVDVTEHKQAEQARQELEEQWRAAFESNPTMYFIVDPAGEIVSVNVFGAEQLGYTVSELVGQPVWNVFYESDRDAVQKHARECFEHPGRMMRWEARKIRKDGTMLWVRETANGVVLKNRPVLLVACENITEQKRAEETRNLTQEALRRSEAYLSEAQRLSKTGSWAWDLRSHKMLYCSDEMCRIYGFDPEQHVPSVDVLLERIHPEDRDRERAESIREGHYKTWHTIEYRLLLPDGTIKHVLTIGHPVIDGSGEVVEIVGTTVDVTERKRAEEELHAAETQFRASVDHLTDALFIHDDQEDQGPVIDVNQQAGDSLGYTREELIGMTALDYDAVLDAAAMASVKERLAHGEIFSFESAHRRKDGTVFPVEVRVRPFWHGDHRFGLAVVRDITDRKRSEQERERLRQLEADIARINRVSMMGELAASLAHEIKQPIAAAATNAKTSLRWLQRDTPDIGEAREAVSRIVKDVIRAADIIDRNRALYRRDTPKREIVNLSELIREMTALLHEAANRHSVSIRVELERTLPAITADRVQMQQVFMNLMLNGIEAMKNTGGELTIRSKGDADGYIQLSVSDSGMGLPVEKTDQIFDAFFTTKAHGTGMGLSISRRIIESHGGRLWATANSDRGATFHFSLPSEVKVVETTLERTGS